MNVYAVDLGYHDVVFIEAKDEDDAEAAVREDKDVYLAQGTGSWEFYAERVPEDV